MIDHSCFPGFKPSYNVAVSLFLLCDMAHLLLHADAGQGSEQATQRIGLVRNGQSTGLRSLLQRSINAAAKNAVVPQKNDTISPEYWTNVNMALAQHAKTEPQGRSVNDPPPPPEKTAWEKITGASQTVQIVDTAQDLSTHTDWEYATPPPPSGRKGGTGTERTMGVVPYDMQLGANIMYSLSEKNTETPPPTQTYVEQAFVAQCPMIMFGAGLRVQGPKCGDHMGTWADPATDRAVLRWKETAQGGLYFGVDSAVTGEGSAYFGMFQEQLTLNRYKFELFNCLQVMRYVVEEEVIKMDHMAPKAYSTMLAHDVGRSQEAFFYKYIIRHPNGTTVGETNMYRLDQNEVNFTLVHDDIPTGIVFASARRTGRWKRDGWKECTGTNRGWEMQFPQDESNFATVATVQDLRVAAAATITLAALRDQEVGYDGFQHTGQSSLYWTLVKTFIELFFVFFAMCIIALIVQRKGWDKKMRRFLFRFEAFMFPRRPVKARLPVLNPTY